MSIRCVLRELEHFLNLPTGAVISIKATYCSSGLHETKASFADEKGTNCPKNVEHEDKIASALVDWLDSYCTRQLNCAKMPPICKFALKNGKGDSEFERSIWDALEKHVPAGQIVSYAKLAELANTSIKQGEGRRYARAVGQIMRRNPVCLLRPCHRVVPSSTLNENSRKRSNSNSNTDYGAYGGVADSKIKRALLDFELRK